MNRWDELKCAALDVAHHITQDPKKRNALADDLITLVGKMVDGVGKVVAVEGESARNGMPNEYEPTEPDDGSSDLEWQLDANSAHTRYLTGESIQRAAEEVAQEARTADLGRWDTFQRDYGGPGQRYGWHPRCTKCGDRGDHTADCAFGQWYCKPCHLMTTPSHKDECPARPGPKPWVFQVEGTQRCTVTSDGMPSCGFAESCPDECHLNRDEFPICPRCGRPSKYGHYSNCPNGH